MLKIAVLIFAIGALGGLFMATRVLRAQMAPWAISLLHAALGATGLVLQSNGNDYRPVFFVCGIAYVLALGVIQLLAPRLERADVEAVA